MKNVFGSKQLTVKRLQIKDAKIGEIHYRNNYVWDSANNIKKRDYFLFEGKMRVNGN